MTAPGNGYCQAGKLPCGAEIYLWGNRRVVDVHNVGNPNYVRLVTSDGPRIVAEVKGTSYPIGSACEADYALARALAVGPELLVAAWEEHRRLQRLRAQARLVIERRTGSRARGR